MQDVVHITCSQTNTSDSIQLVATIVMAKAGDEEAFTRLFEHYKGPLGSRLYHLVNDQEAAYDLYQEVFITVFKEFRKKAPIPNFQPWLYHVARNKAIDYLRHRNQLEFIPLPEPKIDDPEDHALASLLREEGHEERVCERECIKQALAEMSPQYRICVLLQEEWGYSQKEIASILGITEKAVSSNVTRGRKQLHTAYLRTIEQTNAARKGRQN